MTHRMFSTKFVLLDEPDWAPLEGVAQLARTSPDLPPFHEGEFMYMAAVTNTRKGLTIHLYKHTDTRRYLNLDDAGHAYRFCGSDPTSSDPASAGRYRRHTSIADAIEHVQLWLFEDEPTLFRSFPPHLWPDDETAAVSAG